MYTVCMMSEHASISPYLQAQWCTVIALDNCDGRQFQNVDERYRRAAPHVVGAGLIDGVLLYPYALNPGLLLTWASHFMMWMNVTDDVLRPMWWVLV